MKITAIILDDEPLNLRNLYLLLKQYAPEIEVTSTFTDADDAAGFLAGNKTDLIFLDIKMPEKDGFEFLQNFPERQFEVIFVTAYDNFAINAIKESALDYLIKPISIDELKTAVDKAVKKISEKHHRKSQKLCLSHSGGKIYVQPEEITYIRGIDNISKVHTKSGKNIILSKTLKYFECLLRGDGFFRVHKSFVVNLSYVRRFSSTDGGFLLLEDETKIPVSRRNRYPLKIRMEN